MRGLSNADLADHELLRTIHDLEVSETTAALSEILDAETRAVASRLAWMKRMGFVERTLTDKWVLTPRGRDIVNGRAADIMALRDIAARAKRSPAMTWAMRREARRDLG